MRFELLLLSALPTAWAAHVYQVPSSLAVLEANADCNLPDTYQIKEFHAESNDTGKTLSSLEFNYLADSAKLATACYFNSTSKPVSGSRGRTPRYPCADRLAGFIWEDDKKRLTMIQKVCPGSDGKADFEASGSVQVPVWCTGPGQCSTNSTEYHGTFASINPVK